MLWLHWLERLAFTYLVFSVIEYSEHRWLMHRMRIAVKANSKWLAELCKNHMAKHHKRGYRHTTKEPDDSLLAISIVGAVPGIIVAAVAYCFDPKTVLVMGIFGVVYNIVWWVVHYEMHRDEGWFFTRSAWFRYLERRHVMHHVFPLTNYNVLLPLGDWLFGTRATKAQIAAAEAAGAFENHHHNHEDEESVVAGQC